MQIKCDCAGTHPNGISEISKRAIQLVKEPSLRDALLSAYDTPNGIAAVTSAQLVFRELLYRSAEDEGLCRFLAGWRATHGTALYVSGLMVRILRLGGNPECDSTVLLGAAAAKIGEVIAEDTGVDDTPHSELFANFANFVIGSDRWQLAEYDVASCNEFRQYVKFQRLEGSIEEAILTTAASENWNTGEYSHFAHLILPWMAKIQKSRLSEVKEAASYVTVHSGNTELGHFLHAIDAWKLYCEAIGVQPDPEKAHTIMVRYLTEVGKAFKGLHYALAKDHISTYAAFNSSLASKA